MPFSYVFTRHKSKRGNQAPSGYFYKRTNPTWSLSKGPASSPTHWEFSFIMRILRDTILSLYPTKFHPFILLTSHKKYQLVTLFYMYLLLLSSLNKCSLVSARTEESLPGLVLWESHKMLHDCARHCADSLTKTTQVIPYNITLMWRIISIH
jgi:hypothetical protein